LRSYGRFVDELSTEHLFQVGQIRVANALRGGHILSLPLPSWRFCDILHSEKIMYVERVVPFGLEEPKPQKQVWRGRKFMILGEQSSKVVPFGRNTLSAELRKLEFVSFSDSESVVDMLCRFGPCLAESYQTNLDNLCIVTSVSQTHAAEFDWKDNEEPYLCDITCTHSSSASDVRSNSCKADVTRNFHVRPLGQDLSVQEPWGMFAESTEPIIESDIDLDKAGIVEGELEHSSPYPYRPGRSSSEHLHRLASSNTYRAPYYQAAPGVDVIYSRYVEVGYFKVPASLAAAIHWIHDRFPDEAGERQKHFDDILSGKSPMEFKEACS